MDRSNVPLSKIYTFKAACPKCRITLLEKLSKLEPSTAVYTLEVVGEVGKLTIKSGANREKVVEITGQEQLSCENHEKPTNDEVQKQPQIEKENNNSNNTNDNKEEQVCQRVFRGFEGIELHKLAKTNGLTRWELTQNLKMAFSDEKNKVDNKEAPSQGDQNCSRTKDNSLHESKDKDVRKSWDYDESKTCRMV